MQEDRPEGIDVTQLNLALEQRTAGRDYHEYFIPGSIKLVLATWSKEKLDSVAKVNERMFLYRFGFKATRVAREKVIDFQNKYDLSDSEVRWLKRSGHLRVTRTEMNIDASRFMPVAGVVQLPVLSLVFIGMIFQVAYSAAPAWKQGLGQTSLALLWFGGATLLYKLYLAPWRTLKESGAIT